MARTVLNVTKLHDVNTPATPANFSAMLVTPNSANGAEFTAGKDHKTLLLIVNDGTGSATLTIHHGNGLQGVADLNVTLSAGQFTIVTLDSGRFKNVSGADKGKVLLSGTAKVAVFEGP